MNKTKTILTHTYNITKQTYDHDNSASMFYLVVYIWVFQA